MSVRPEASGQVEFTIEHLDPFGGWLPFKHREATVSGGQGNLTWTPPSIGRWRVSADVLGTRDYAPSESGYDHALEAKPL